MNLKQNGSLFVTVIGLILAACLAIAPGAGSISRAETTSTVVGGPITQNTTWTKAGSPYLATSSVVVRENVTLTIEPGVEVRFAANRGMTVNGGLVARGTGAEPIIFTANSNTPVPGAWTNIEFSASAMDAQFNGAGAYTGGSIIQYALVEYGGDGSKGALALTDSSPWIDHTTIRNNAADGLALQGNNLRITNNVIHENGSSGVHSAGNVGTGSVVQANVLWGNTSYGIGLENIATGAEVGVVIRDNTVYENGDGIYVGWDPNTVITGNHVYRNERTGIWAWYSSVIDSNIVAYNGSDSNSYGIYAFFATSIARNKIAQQHGVYTGLYLQYSGSAMYNSLVFNDNGQGSTAATLASCNWDPSPQFRFNTIVGNTGGNASGGNGVGGIEVTGGTNCKLTNNNLYGNDGYQLYLNTPYQAGGDLLDARSNYWGTTDELQINDAIKDYYDDAQLAEVNYDNYLNAPETAAPPAPPTNLQVDVSFDAFVLTWAANKEADIAGYKVYYDTDGEYPWDGKGAKQGNAGIDVGKVTTFQLSGLTPGRNVSFMVTAYDTTGDESWYSLEQVRRLPALINLSAKAGSRNVLLEWNPTNDANFAGYRLLRAISGTATYQGVAQNLVDTTYFDKDGALIAGTDYCYKVDALRSSGERITTSNVACATFGRLELWTPDTVGKVNDSVRVPINIRNADGLRIGSSDIWLDFDGSVLEFTNVERTPLTLSYAWAHAVQPVGGALQRVRISYIHNAPNQAPPELHGDGSLFMLAFKVKGADGSDSQLDLKEYIVNVGGSAIQNENLTDLPLDVLDGLFKVRGAASAAFILGDVDGDGVVRALDAALALRLAAGLRQPTPQELQAGDINGNGVIQAADASMILYFAGNGQWPPLPPTLIAAAATSQATTVGLTDIVGRAGTTVQTTLRATGLQQMAGGDFVLVYDTAQIAKATKVSLAGLTTGFDKLEFRDDGAGRLFFSMADNGEISGDGLLATIDLQVANGVKVGSNVPLLLAEARLNDLNGRDFVKAFVANTLTRQNGTLTVGNLYATPVAFNFTAITGQSDPPAQTLQIDSGAVSWSATASENWIWVSPGSGSGASDVSVSVFTGGLNPGIHTGTIEVTAGSEISEHDVTLVLNDANAQPVLAVSPTLLSFSASVGGGNPAAQSFAIQNNGTGTLGFTLSSDQSWLQVDQASGVAPATISVGVDVSGLSVGTHSGHLTVTANGASSSPQAVDVSVTIGDGPVIADKFIYLPLVTK